MDPHGSSGIYPTPRNETHESKFVRDPYPEMLRPMIDFTHQPESKYVRDPLIHSVPETEVIGDMHHNLRPHKFVNDIPLEDTKLVAHICKDTKYLRDECIKNNGLEKCDNEISAHNSCLRREGFHV